jgi:hypothetical protein
MAEFIGAISLIILCLISEWAQWFLCTFPFEFLGKVSYTLYLIHELIVVWAQRDTLNALMANGVGPELAVLYVWLIYTPVLLLVSWVLEFTVDTPAKKFSNELDVQVRKVRPPPPKSVSEDTGEITVDENYYSCWSFTKRIWPIFAMIGWLLFVLITTEVFIKFHAGTPHHFNTHETEGHED